MHLFHFNNLKRVIHSLEDLIKILEVCQQALWEEEMHNQRGAKGEKKRIKRQKPRKKHSTPALISPLH